MISIYRIVGQAIKDQVKQITWIDMDKGQLDNAKAFESLHHPACLIGQSDIEWSGLGGGHQQGEGTITVKTVVVLPSETFLADPLLSNSIDAEGIVDKVRKAVLSVPGITSRTRSSDYPSDTSYVFEETFACLFKSSPSIREVPVSVSINPQLVKPTAV